MPVSTSTHKFTMADWRAKSLFLPHNLRQVLSNSVEGGPPVLGYALIVTSTQQARFVAALGFDFVWIDPEHSPTNVETLTELVHTVSFMSEGRSTAVVRLPGHDHAWIGYALDAGAGGIMIPQVDNAEQARAVCSYATFGERNGGTRSVPPFRLIAGISDLAPKNKTAVDVWNEHVAIIVQIESMEGVNNIEEICQVDRVDCVWIGASDLRVSMGLPMIRGGGTEPEYLAACSKVLEACEKYGKAIGGFAFPPAMEQQAKGKHFIIVASDALHLHKDAQTLDLARTLFQDSQ